MLGELLLRGGKAESRQMSRRRELLHTLQPDPDNAGVGKANMDVYGISTKQRQAVAERPARLKAARPKQRTARRQADDR